MSRHEVEVTYTTTSKTKIAWLWLAQVTANVTEKYLTGGFTKKFPLVFFKKTASAAFR